MKRLLISIGSLILAAGCSPFFPPMDPSNIPEIRDIPEVTTATLTGIVVEVKENGSVPVEGATVEVLRGKAKPRTQPGEGEYAAVRTAVTDASGQCAFDGLDFGVYLVRVSKEGLVPYSIGNVALFGNADVFAPMIAGWTANPGLRIGR